MIYGLILSAGKQSRFKSEIPKALTKLKNKKCILDINIENMLTVCDSVHVVCSYENEEFFKDYPHITIESGLGSGDAVYKALKEINHNPFDSCFIQWGDSIQSRSIYEFLKLLGDEIPLIPCKYEKDPYVEVIATDFDKVGFKFYKFNEDISNTGYHDLSLFYGNINQILDACQFYIKEFMVDGKYKHKHGNEFEFLDLFNDTPLKGNLVDASLFDSYCFNTIEEFNKMEDYYENQSN